MRTSTTSRSMSLAVALLAVTSLFAAGCSSKGSSDSKAETTTTEAAGETTTTADGGDKKPADPGDEGPSQDDLEAILPAAADLGDEWSADTTPDTSDDSGPDLETICPDAAGLGMGGNDEDESDNAKAKYVNDQFQNVEISLDPSAKEIDPDDLDALTEALNDCKPEPTTDENGIDTTFSFEVNTLDDYGDQGLQIETHVTLSGEQLPDTIELTIYTLVFRNGTAGVELSGSDGFDKKTAEVNSFDPDLLINLADDIEPKVDDLVS